MERKKTQAVKRVLAATAFLAVLISIAAATATFVRAATPFTVSFDFDTGTPSLSMGQSIPFNQTSGEVTAYFSSPSGPAAFSIQSDSTTFYKLSQFSGKYLYDNSPLRDTLEIKLSHYLNSITFSFATIEYRGSSGDEPSNITLTAYVDSTATTPIGSAKARGTWPSGGDTHPQGTLNFNSGSQQFSLVKIELPYQGPRSAVDFLVDNITVTTTGPIVDSTPSVTTTSLSGTLGNQGWYTSDVTISLSATDDMSGVNKTEYSFDNATWTVYTAPFAVTTEGTTAVYYRSTDNAGNMEASNAVYFNVDTTPSNITDVSQIPADNMQPEDTVKINVTVTDAVSGVEWVALNYTNGNGTWITRNMTNLEGNVWNATIQSFPYGTNVTYVIIPEDNAGNTITTEQIYGYKYEYQVVPEFPTASILSLVMLMVTLAIFIANRKLTKHSNTKLNPF